MLLPEKKDNATLGDLRLIVRDEMKVLFPISKWRDLLFECRQKNGQSVSEYYLELKDLAQDCDLDKMGTESLLCHLLLRGLNNSEMKLHEKIILDSEGAELKDAKVSSLIATSEMYKSSSRKSTHVNKVESKQNNNKQ